MRYFPAAKGEVDGGWPNGGRQITLVLLHPARQLMLASCLQIPAWRCVERHRRRFISMRTFLCEQLIKWTLNRSIWCWIHNLYFFFFFFNCTMTTLKVVRGSCIILAWFANRMVQLPCFEERINHTKACALYRKSTQSRSVCVDLNVWQASATLPVCLLVTKNKLGFFFCHPSLD